MARSARSDPDSLLAELENAEQALEDARAAIRDAGEDRVRRVADVYEEFTSLLDRYESKASGTGRETFQNYVEFEGKLETFEEGLADDLPRVEAFEAAADILDRRRLDERDFERAREELAPARELVDLLERRDRAEARLQQARSAVEARIREIDDRLDELDELLQFADADLDAPVEELREPIEAYGEAVEAAFREYRSEASAQEVLDLVAGTSTYPLVDFREPPSELREYLAANEVGEESITTLLEYAGYSHSKLSHYVEDAATFRGNVATNQTYLERLDAEPLRIDWPPPSAEELQFRVREYLPVVDRFADEDVVGLLREVRELARDSRYGDLRESALAREALSKTERERLASGDLASEREELTEERERLEAAPGD